MRDDECDLKDYPPAGGDGSGSNACDEYPPVETPEHISDKDGCTCPPPKPVKQQAMAALSWIPFVGQILISTVGQVPNCADLLAERQLDYEQAQKDFQNAVTDITSDQDEIVTTLGNVVSWTEGSDKLTGILPTTMDMLTAYAKHTLYYLSVIAVAVGLVILGVTFTL